MGHKGEKTTVRAHTDKTTATPITLIFLNAPGVWYDAAKALHVQDIPIMAGSYPMPCYDRSKHFKLAQPPLSTPPSGPERGTNTVPPG